MQDSDGQNIRVELSLLEKNIEQLVLQLTDCRKENEALRSELASLQNILRSCKLPGSGSAQSPTDGSMSEGALSGSEKMQFKQRLVLLLQKIEMELRNSQPL
uniref:Uncharacterized protein n=1 Tax=Chlorobium chlorochromatii (strain CaD3) TaxID=340177 RepID=Q3AQC7_CHLCH